MVLGCSGPPRHETCLGIERERARFFLGLESYMSVAEVKKTLSLEKRKNVVFDEFRAPIREGTPPYNTMIVTIPGLQLNGFEGRVRLTFFNDRLSDFWFFPVDIEEFVRTDAGLVRATAPWFKADVWYNAVKVEGFTLINLAPFVDVWVHVPRNNTFYIGLADTRLRSQGYRCLRTK
jgi:hypothetical protein